MVVHGTGEISEGSQNDSTTSAILVARRFISLQSYSTAPAHIMDMRPDISWQWILGSAPWRISGSLFPEPTTAASVSCSTSY